MMKTTTMSLLAAFRNVNKLKTSQYRRDWLAKYWRYLRKNGQRSLIVMAVLEE